MKRRAKRGPRKTKDQLKVYNKQYYEENKSKFVARAKAHKAKYRTRMRYYIACYLSEHSCVDCGETDILVLEFDHRDPSEKSFTIAHAMHSKWAGLETIKSEIEKCDVRCANCHARRTYSMMGYRSRHLPSEEEMSAVGFTYP